MLIKIKRKYTNKFKFELTDECYDDIVIEVAIALLEHKYIMRLLQILKMN